MKQDIKELVLIFNNLYELSNYRQGVRANDLNGILIRMTKALHLEKNKQWKDLVFKHKADAYRYFDTKPIELLHYNGMSLRDWPEKEITRKVIFEAIHAIKRPLSVSAIVNTKKIYNKLTNDDLLELSIIHGGQARDENKKDIIIPNPNVLKHINKRKSLPKKLLKLKTTKEWAEYFKCKYFFLNPFNKKDFEKYAIILKSLNPPKEFVCYIDKLQDFAKRYFQSNPTIGSVKINYIPLSLDEQENNEFIAYAKINGFDIRKPASEYPYHDLHYKEYIKALDNCLMLKYNEMKGDNKC